jgi:hypothetical protein
MLDGSLESGRSLLADASDILCNDKRGVARSFGPLVCFFSERIFTIAKTLAALGRPSCRPPRLC